MTRRRSTFAAGVGAALLAACGALPPADVRPGVPLPAQWQAGATAPDAPAVRTDWWTGFGSPELDRLVSDALAGNRDLQAAASRIAQARALAQVAGAATRPTLAGSVDAARERGADGGSSTALGARLGASLDLDPWGRERAAQAAADRRVVASAHARDALALALQAEVATTYFRLLSAQDRLAVARRNLEVADSTLRLLQAQRDAGAISRLELVRQQGLLATVRAGVAPLERERQQALDALAVLLGRPVQALAVTGTSLEALRLPEIGAGVPSEWLVHRPDIRGAEAALAAAQADVAAARAALLPSVRLTAALGVEAGSLGGLLRSGDAVGAIAAALVAPILDGGRLRGQVRFAEARHEELVHGYAQAILAGLREVEDGLVALQRLAEQAVHEQAVVDRAAEALELADLRYRNGAVDFATVLDAQRVQLDALAARQATTLARFDAAVALFRALGGGWQAGTGG